MMRKVLLLGVLFLLPYALRAQLGEAVNATNLTWTTSGTGGNTGWFVQSTNTHDGISAAAAAISGSSRLSTLQTTVMGPGTLTFWWRKSSLQNVLVLISSGVPQSTPFARTDWEENIVYFGSGVQTLRWDYYYAGGSDSDRGYLDEVNFTPGSTPPIILSQPAGQSQVAGLSATFAVSAVGTPPLSYQWQHAGTNIPGATTTEFIVTNLGAADLGYYSVVVSNGFDSVISSNAPLEFGTATAWGSGETVTNGASNIIAVAAGGSHNLALREDGSLLCWGGNLYGQISTPSDLTNVKGIAASTFHSAAVKADGTVGAWGAAAIGGVGVTNVPPDLSNVAEVAMGKSHAIALMGDGTVVAWGENSFGQTNIPPGLKSVAMIAAGAFHTLALKADGSVTTWGRFIGENVSAGSSNFVAVAAGDSHNLALRRDGTVLAWGNNYHGQTNVPAGLTNVVAVGGGMYHSLALKADGTLVGWGDNSYGQTNVPSGLTNVVAISVFGTHNLALVGNGPILHAPLSDAKMSNGVFSVSLPSQSGHVFALEYKESLADSNWTMLPLVAGTGRTLTLTDPSAAGHQRFYRVRRW